MRISDWSSDVCSSDLILPEGRYRLADGHPGKALFGWMSGQYRFDTYRPKREARGARVLLTADVAAIAPMVAEMRAVAPVREPVNTPAADMRPATLEKEAERKHGRAPVCTPVTNAPLVYRQLLEKTTN